MERNAWLTGIDKPFVDEGASGGEIAEGAIFSETHQHRILDCSLLTDTTVEDNSRYTAGMSR